MRVVADARHVPGRPLASPLPGLPCPATHSRSATAHIVKTCGVRDAVLRSSGTGLPVPTVHGADRRLGVAWLPTAMFPSAMRNASLWLFDEPAG
jgi:hypothetical protein